MEVTLLVILTAILALITWWYIEVWQWNKYLKKFPFPPLIPIFGNAHLFRSTTDVLPVFLKLYQKYGGIFKLTLGIKPRLIICEAKGAEWLLGSATILEKSYEYKYLHSWLGTGLLTSHGAKWKRQRRLITPTFHFQMLDQFIHIFDNQSDVLVEKLSENADNKPINIFPYITLCTLDIICEAAMGTSINAQNESDSKYVKNVKEMCRIIVDRSFSIIKMWDTLYPLSKDYKIEQEALKVLHDHTDYVIVKRREQITNNSNVSNGCDTDTKQKLAFLDLLLQCQIDGQPLPDDVIREEVDTFMFEGHDTTASGISFVLYMISKHPDVQEQIISELRAIFGDHKSSRITYQNLQEMKYLEMVIKETLRLYPPVVGYGRVLNQEVMFNGNRLPKGLVVMVFAYALHRDPNVFPNPEVFDPERFSVKNSVGRSPFAYVPFSAGPRNCIGQKFAMLEIKSAVSKLLRNFELLPVPEHKPILSVETIIKSANGLPLRLKRRQL